MVRVFLLLSFATVALTARALETNLPGTVNSSPSSNEQVFQVKGLVLELKPAEKSVKIKHEEVPGYMPAMTMWFDVKEANELAGIEAGDPVAFRMIVTDTYGWIDQIRKTGPKQNDLPTTGPFRLVRDVEPLNEGGRLPEYHFTNQLGQAFSTAQFKGQVLAINFLFTRCPFPTFCPQTARYFTTTQQKLLSSSNAPTNWHLLTISFDPEFDKPDVLKRYAEHYDYNSNYWTFATGALIDITAIGDQLGLKFWRDGNGGFDHNLRTVVIDPSGRVQKIFVGNEWTPEELVTEMTLAPGKK
jgi:protein SCO1/2